MSGEQPGEWLPAGERQPGEKLPGGKQPDEEQPKEKQPKEKQPEAKQLEVCDICGLYQPTQLTTKLTCNCRNLWCRDCLRRVFRMAINDPYVSMPPRCCATPISVAEIAHFLGENLVRDYQRALDDWNDPTPLYCPRRTCSAKVTRFPEARNGVIGICAACNTQICAICTHEAHPGSQCVEDPEEIAMREISYVQGWQRCRNCGRVVSKTTGCDHIKCLCRAEFCYQCGAPWHNRMPTCRCDLHNVGNDDDGYGYGMADDDDDEDDDAQVYDVDVAQQAAMARYVPPPENVPQQARPLHERLRQHPVPGRGFQAPRNARRRFNQRNIRRRQRRRNTNDNIQQNPFQTLPGHVGTPFQGILPAATPLPIYAGVHTGFQYSGEPTGMPFMQQSFPAQMLPPPPPQPAYFQPVRNPNLAQSGPEYSLVQQSYWLNPPAAAAQHPSQTYNWSATQAPTWPTAQATALPPMQALSWPPAQSPFMSPMPQPAQPPFMAPMPQPAQLPFMSPMPQSIQLPFMSSSPQSAQLPFMLPMPQTTQLIQYQGYNPNQQSYAFAERSFEREPTNEFHAHNWEPLRGGRNYRARNYQPLRGGRSLRREPRGLQRPREQYAAEQQRQRSPGRERAATPGPSTRRVPQGPQQPRAETEAERNRQVSSVQETAANPGPSAHTPQS